MKTNINGQVPLSKLIFTVNWEDPESDVKAIKDIMRQINLLMLFFVCKVAELWFYYCTIEK